MQYPAEVEQAESMLAPRQLTRLLQEHDQLLWLRRVCPPTPSPPRRPILQRSRRQEGSAPWEVLRSCRSVAGSQRLGFTKEAVRTLAG